MSGDVETKTTEVTANASGCNVHGETQDAKEMQGQAYVLQLKTWRIEDAAIYLS